MLIGYLREYKGYKGTIEYSYEDGVYYGELTDSQDFVNYEGKNVVELYESFKNAVDDYIEFKEEVNKLW